MRLLDDVRLIESVIFAPPTISTRAHQAELSASARSLARS